MKYTCNNKINQVYDRHYKLKYLSNMNIKAQGVEGGKRKYNCFLKAKSMLTAASKFWNARTDAGMTLTLKKSVI